MEYWNNMTTKQKVKTVFIGLLGLLLIVFIVQNWGQIDFHFLFWTFKVKLIFLIIICTLIGFAIGYFFRGRKLNKPQEKEFIPDEKEAAKIEKQIEE